MCGEYDDYNDRIDSKYPIFPNDLKDELEEIHQLSKEERKLRYMINVLDESIKRGEILSFKEIQALTDEDDYGIGL